MHNRSWCSGVSRGNDEVVEGVIATALSADYPLLFTYSQDSAWRFQPGSGGLEQGSSDQPSLLVSSCAVNLPALLRAYSAVLSLEPSRLPLYFLTFIGPASSCSWGPSFQWLDWPIAACMATTTIPSYTLGIPFGNRTGRRRRRNRFQN